MPEPAYRRAAAIVHALLAAGHQGYLAGGCVRDLLLARTPDDYDVATSATPDEVVSLFTGLGRKTLAVGAPLRRRARLPRNHGDQARRH